MLSASKYALYIAFSLVLAPPAMAQEVPQSQPVQIRVKSSGQCMDVYGASAENGTRILQYTCDGRINQMWTLRPVGDYYRLVAEHSGKCLGIAARDVESGAQAIQWPCNDDDPSQQFAFESLGDESYLLKARHSGRCLAISDASTQTGANVVQTDCSPTAESQQWSIPLDEKEPRPIQISVKSSEQCIDVFEASTESGARVVQYTCHNGANQLWTLQSVDTYYRLVSEQSGKCLSVAANDVGSGARAIQWPCNDDDHAQQFALVSLGNKNYLLKARHSSRCLAISGASMQAGADVVQTDCSPASESQQWSILSEDLAKNPSQQGHWGPVIEMPLVPVAASNLPNGKILMWSAYDRYKYGGTDYRKTYTAIFDPVTEEAPEKLVEDTQHDMFCPGTALLADGRLLVNGGRSNRNTSLYDQFQNSWARAGDMLLPRGYQANTLLPDGRVFTIGGSWDDRRGGKDGEIWDPASGQWTKLAGALVEPMLTADPEGFFRSDNHAWLITAPDGNVLQAGPSKQMNWYSVAGSGSTQPAGFRDDDSDSMNGNAVAYDIGKVLKIGGARAYVEASASKSAYLIDINNGVRVEKLSEMAEARTFHNSVVLPDGKVVVVGGLRYAKTFSDEQAVLDAEIWNPETKTFTTVAPMAVPRAYHSVALLLPDGRVLAGGGGLCGSCDRNSNENHPNIEIYTPPYLYNADGTFATRPKITSPKITSPEITSPEITAKPIIATTGRAITVSTDSAVRQFALVRLGSVTHSINNDQRRIPLVFENLGGNQYSLEIPDNKGVVLPGYYMLFALNADGVPSVSVTLQVI